LSTAAAEEEEETVVVSPPAVAAAAVDEAGCRSSEEEEIKGLAMLVFATASDPVENPGFSISTSIVDSNIFSFNV
jgi:hypothetical protein